MSFPRDPNAGTSTETAASGFLARFERDGHLPVVLALTGPAGAGKTAVLDAIEEECRRRGLTVRRGRAAVLDGPDGVGHDGIVRLVDDVHEFGDEDLRRLAALVEEPGGRLAFAFRPWPHSEALGRLAGSLARRRRLTRLGILHRTDIAALALARGRSLPDPVLDGVGEETGGMAWLVDRLLDDLPAPGGADPAAPSAALVLELGAEYRRARPELQELLLALAVGFDAATWSATAGDTRELVAEGHATGLLLADGGLVPLLRAAVLGAVPVPRLRRMQRLLVDTLVGEDRPIDGIAHGLARSGYTDPRVARSLERAGDELLATQPARAATLYREARTAGGDALATAARRAQAAYAVGRIDEAGRLVDELLSLEDPPDLARTVDTAAAVWAQRGMLRQSADGYRWLGDERRRGSAALAAVALIGVGDRRGVERVAGESVAPPTLSRVALTLLRDGIEDSLTATAAGALPALVRASDAMTATGAVLPMPESPAALAALVALHAGEPRVAESVLDAAIRGGQGGAPSRARLLLLRAWGAMQSDQLDHSHALALQAAAASSPFLPRDELLASALDVALARRADDAAELVRAWRRARDTILHIPVDLYSLLPLGELVVAAARLRDAGRLESHVAEAWRLLGDLGDPPLWSVHLRWASVQAAILTERPADVAPHAAALVRASVHSRVATVFAGAGRAWMAVLAGDFDPGAVESAARGLAGIGLPWDGSRLAGHAAARAEERADMTRLLACARELHSAEHSHAQEDTQPQPRPRLEVARDDAGLSAREREVGRLVLDGKNYREIGEAIFISPRTVEHHVARIRQRLDARTRSELLTELRLVFGTDDASDGDLPAGPHPGQVLDPPDRARR